LAIKPFRRGIVFVYFSLEQDLKDFKDIQDGRCVLKNLSYSSFSSLASCSDKRRINKMFWKNQTVHFRLEQDLKDFKDKQDGRCVRKCLSCPSFSSLASCSDKEG